MNPHMKKSEVNTMNAVVSSADRFSDIAPRYAEEFHPLSSFVMTKRREFIKTGIAGGLAAAIPLTACSLEPKDDQAVVGKDKDLGPIVLSTWSHGVAANEKAWEVISTGGHALDAAEQGVMVTESDFTNRSVGLGGRPDRDGHVTLDACIQDHDGRCGGVAFLEHFEHPISIARKVMEDTPHVLIVGQGARQFALGQGFKENKIVIPEVKEAWQEWMKKEQYQPKVNIENHDTIGLICRDQQGRIAGSCTTSGLAYKMHGRVGDSPIIGAGLFVDGDVGAAVATGVGEMVIRTAGSHSVVELMRQGMSPDEACKQVVGRILKKHPEAAGMQVGFLAINNSGQHGAWAIYEGFDHALTTTKGAKLIKAGFEKKWE